MDDRLDMVAWQTHRVGDPLPPWAPLTERHGVDQSAQRDALLGTYDDWRHRLWQWRHLPAPEQLDALSEARLGDDWHTVLLGVRPLVRCACSGTGPSPTRCHLRATQEDRRCDYCRTWCVLQDTKGRIRNAELVTS